MITCIPLFAQPAMPSRCKSRGGLLRNAWCEKGMACLYLGFSLANLFLSQPHFRMAFVQELHGQPDRAMLRSLCKKGCEAAIDVDVCLVDYQKNQVSTTILYRLLQGCIDKKSLALGRNVHQLIKKSGHNLDTFLGSHLIRMYGVCGSLAEAGQVFKGLADATVYTWSALIWAHAKLEQGEEALRLFKDMQLCSGIHPNTYTFVAVLKACASIPALAHGRLVHFLAVECCFDSDIHLCNTLVYMYAKCSSLNNARVIFDRLFQRSLVTWNVMISGYAHQGHGDDALQVFRFMLQRREVPDKVTYISVLKACSTAEECYRLGMVVHVCVVEMRLEKDDHVQSSLIDMYIKCGDLAGAWNVFDKVQMVDCVVTWNAMIAGCANQGWTEEGLRLFGLMQKANLLPDMVTLMAILRACAGLNGGDDGKIIHAFIVENFHVIHTELGNTLLDMYAKCMRVFDAYKIFQMLPKKDVVTWTAMIGAYVSCRNGSQALQLFQGMQEEGVDPNEITYANVLKACSIIASVEHGKLIHVDVVLTCLESDALLGGALVDMYSKCGSMDDAASVFTKLLKRSVVTWSSMFAGFAINGHYGLAWKCLQDMQLEGFRPDSVTILSWLSACSQLGSSEEGCTHFRSTFQGHSEDPWVEHYTCLLHLLVQAGCPTEARSLFETMPLPSDSVGWMAFLHNCQRYGNAGFAHKCFDHVASP